MNSILLAAVDNNDGIGLNGKLLHHNPVDLQRFKRLTGNRVLLMGRKTFESLPRILPGRPHVVVSRGYTNVCPPSEGPWTRCASVLDGLEMAEEMARHEGLSGVAVIGGAEVYAQTIALVDTCYITHFFSNSRADTFFPTDLLSRYHEPTRGEDSPEYSFTVYRKIGLDQSH